MSTAPPTTAAPTTEPPSLWESDFTEYSTGSPPTDWTERIGSMSSWDVESFTQTGYLGNQAMYHDGPLNTHCFISWDTPGSIQDGEVLVKLKLSASIGAYEPYICLRASGSSAATRTFYAVSLGGTPGVRLAKWISGTYTLIEQKAVDFSNGIDLFVRFRVDGTSLKVRVWNINCIEPEDWLIEQTDSSISAAGWVGIHSYTGYLCYIDYIGVRDLDVDSDPVPFPPTPSWSNYSDKETGFTTFRGWVLDATTLVNHVRALGGQFGDHDKYLKQVRVWCGSAHSSQVRVAVYSGGSLSAGPVGATLLYDFGQTSGSTTSAYQTLTVTGTRPAIPKNTPLWIAIKGNDSGFQINNINHSGHCGNFQEARGRWLTTSIDYNEANAFASTWPTDAGGSFSTSWWDAGYWIEFDDAATDTTAPPTTAPPTTVAPTTVAPTTAPPTTAAPTTAAPTTVYPSTYPPSTAAPTTLAPTTLAPTTAAPEYWETCFAEYAIGTPGDWTERWHTTVSAPSIVANADADCYGGKSLSLSDVSSNRYALSWDDPGDQDDVEVLSKIKVVENTDGVCRVVIRGSGTTAESGYYVDCFPVTGVFQLYKYVSAAATQLGGNLSKDADLNDKWWIRMRMIGTSLKVRVWEDGTAEPGTWDWDLTDSSLSSGWVGVGKYHGVSQFDWFAVATNGATARAPEDVSGCTTVPPTTAAPTTPAPTTLAPTTEAPTTLAPTTSAPTTLAPTTLAPSTLAPTTLSPSTAAPTTLAPTTVAGSTSPPSTVLPTTVSPTTLAPTTAAPTTLAPTTLAPTTLAPTTEGPQYEIDTGLSAMQTSFTGTSKMVAELTGLSEMEKELS